MSVVRIWVPVAGSAVFVVIATALALHVPPTAIALVPLPAAVHVSSQRIAALDAETHMPLFAPSRSNVPAGTAGQAPPVPPPTLTGIVIGGGRAVALVKSVKGDTVIAHAGDTIDGWTIVSIAQGAIVVQRGGVQQTVDLVFGSAKGSAPATMTIPSVIPLGGHPAMASPSFDGLAAVRQRGLPEANIPTGSPLSAHR